MAEIRNSNDVYTLRNLETEDVFLNKMEKVLLEKMQEFEKEFECKCSTYCTKEYVDMNFRYTFYVQLSNEDEDVSCLFVEKKINKAIEMIVSFCDIIGFYKFVRRSVNNA